MEQLLQTLVRYVQQSVNDQGGSLTRTKLHKLLYLVDLEYYREYRTLLTGLQWIFHHYGPYAPALDPLVSSFPDDFSEERRMTQAGREAIVYKGSWDESLEDRVDRKAKLIIDRIMQGWALDDLQVILDYVYFETEPMANAQRGDTLSFETVKPVLQSRQVLVTRKSNQKQMEDLRKRFREYFKNKPPRRTRSLGYTNDLVYLEALRIMNSADAP